LGHEKSQFWDGRFLTTVKLMLSWKKWQISLWNKQVEAVAVLKKIYESNRLKGEIEQLSSVVEEELQQVQPMERIGYFSLFSKKEIRLALLVGVGLQMFQQLTGISTVMYYSPTIVELAGFVSNKTTLLLSLMVSGMNVIGSIIGISLWFSDGCWYWWLTLWL
jgi:hypothetical protein